METPSTPNICSILGVVELANLNGDIFLNPEQLEKIESVLHTMSKKIETHHLEFTKDDKVTSEFEESIIDFCKECEGADYSEFENHFTLSIPMEYWKQLLKNEEFKKSVIGKGFNVSDEQLIVTHDDIKLFV